jgi:hypothetical protein
MVVSCTKRKTSHSKIQTVMKERFDSAIHRRTKLRPVIRQIIEQNNASSQFFEHGPLLTPETACR